MHPLRDDLLCYFRRLAPKPTAGARDDDQLLARHLQGDGDAFAELAARYAPLVWGVCRRTLADYHDAEDAFQAVFVILAHKAPSLTGGPLGPWLHKVARDVALKANVRAARRRETEARARSEPVVHDAAELERRERDAALEEELGRLPERFRRPLVLCYLEGLTNEEAARRLGCPRGTVLSRLARGRERLRQRLARRGFDLSSGVMPALALPAPSAWIEEAERVGSLVAAGESSGLSTSVMDLAKGVMFAMLVRKLKVAGVALFLMGLIAAGAGWLTSVVAGPAEVPKAARRVTLRPPLQGGAARAEVAAPGHLVYRVTTDLQRELVPAGTNLFTLLDTTEAVRDGKAAPERLKLEDLRKELLKHKKADDKIVFTLFFRRAERADFGVTNLLRYAMIGFGHGVGFSQVTALGLHNNSDVTWGDYIKPFRGQAGRVAAASEPAEGNRLVKVYPVRTELSRYLTSGADCAVVILQPWGKEKGEIPKEVRQATSDSLGKLKLARKRKVSFHVSHVGAEVGEQLLNELEAFAKALGFETSSVSFR